MGVHKHNWVSAGEASMSNSSWEWCSHCGALKKEVYGKRARILYPDSTNLYPPW